MESPKRGLAGWVAGGGCLIRRRDSPPGGQSQMGTVQVSALPLIRATYFSFLRLSFLIDKTGGRYQPFRVIGSFEKITLQT